MVEPNEWYNLDVEYTGWGTAYFENPKGWVEGPTRCHFTALGEMQVVMSVEQWHNKEAEDDPSNVYARMWLSVGHRIKDQTSESHPSIVLPQPNLNHCTRLVVQIDNGGEFTTEDVLQYFWTSIWWESEPEEIQFNISGGTFTLQEYKRDQLRYWSTPLVNFIGEFELSANDYDDLSRHPLRVFPAPDDFEVSYDGLSEKEIIASRLNDHARSLVIPFEWFNKIGFIERLPDYEENVKKLRSGEISMAVTSLMVGSLELGSNLQFAIDILPLLSISCGVRVGSPWLEIHDASGKLIIRIHGNHFFRDDFKQGRKISMSGKTTSQLIASASKSAYFGKKTMRMCLTNLAEALTSTNVRYGLLHTFTILDLVYIDILKLKDRDEDLVSNLSTDNANEVERILDNCVKQLERVRRKSRDESNDYNAIKKIISKLGQEKYRRSKRLAERLAAILEHKDIDLKDILALKNYYGSLEDYENQWFKPVGKYRNQTVHSFYVTSDRKTLTELSGMYPHLIDLSVRIILKLCDYSGKYLHPYRPAELSVDWVEPDTSITDLGYRHHSSS